MVRDVRWVPDPNALLLIREDGALPPRLDNLPARPQMVREEFMREEEYQVRLPPRTMAVKYT